MVDLEALLGQTSRTFALSIPQLPEPTRRAVTLAYLLFRIADTFEDAAVWPRAARSRALEAFTSLLEDSSLRDGTGTPANAEAYAQGWVLARPCEHKGYLELLAASAEVMAETARLDDATRAVVLGHTARTAIGMREYVLRSSDAGALRLQSLEELRAYCYIVAGIVGEMLTELFVLHAPELGSVAMELGREARRFGEGLQLVNILKDATDDARDGRVYLPTGVALTEVFACARGDLDAARSYVLTLQIAGAPRGFVEFTAVPVVLARATLDGLEASGPGTKLSRESVFARVSEVSRRLDGGLAVID